VSESLLSSIEVLRDRIARAGRDPDTVTLVAVTKGFGLDVVLDALGSGLVDLGENYAQDLHSKADALGGAQQAAVRWHFIGRLQTNKVRLIAAHVALWQSVDRRPLAVEIAKRAPGAEVLVQVNTSDEPQKGGCAPVETEALVASCRDLGLHVRGLMCVGPAADLDASRRAFRSLSALADDFGLRERSMGMSDDLEAALAEGSTMVRVGTALFGTRPAQPGAHR
jgi:pyridoxal phosphate enzyme (YggS family)